MMWAIRRAAHPLRSHGYFLEAPRALCAKSGRLSNALENFIGSHVNDLSLAGRCPSPRGIFNGPSFPTKFFSQSRTLSSEAGTKSSDDEGDLEEGFSELETPDTNSFGIDNTGEENTEALVSEPELSDDESEGNLSESGHHEPDLSDNEAAPKGGKEPRKKASDSPLFKVIMEAPRQSIRSAIDKWVEEGKPLGRTELSIAMLNLRKRRMFGRALQLLEWLEANKQIDITERDYASRLDLIAKVHGLHKAEKYIEKIPQSFRGEVIYRTLLAYCASTLNVKKAEEIFNKIRDLGFPLTVFACNQLLMLYKRLDRKKIADVLLMMEKENIKPSLFTYKLLIDTKGRSNDMTGMEQILETMKAEGLEPDLLLQAMVARHFISGGLNEKAQAVLKEMEGDSLKVNRGACKLLLPLYAALGEADEVDRIWNVCETNLRLEECLAAIEAWGKLGRVENAEAVFEKMLKQWKKLSQKYYTAILKVYADHKLLAKGKDVAKRMADNGCPVGPFTLDALVKLYVEAGEVEKADSILQKATQQNQMKPLYSSYLSVLDKYAKRGDIHNAEKIFHRSRQAGYVARIQQYQALLQAYVNGKAPAYGFRERLKADNMFPSKTLAAQLARVDAFRKTPISDLLD
ncbi:pentatricopeptide repeat-containing protein At1g80270, mitochondrial-like [Magnolia sinica]|uniref:pentatricopeptide repeat-containing protein At1g80270, mitochondrial-like n=1 Tax=Magnolia sinica TaxID=86752 RepID=UPI00265B431E|nr:pentatricopeptide repeat-containing protein At1g80270, mitochondrial-like [Magnolia sinica]